MEKRQKDKTDTALNSRTKKHLQKKSSKLEAYLSAEKHWAEKTNKVRTYYKVRTNVEKSYQTRWLQMHYSREKRCQHTKIQRLIKYATTNLRRNVIGQN